MRSMADEAGVDAALISYHFGSKRGLFGAAMQLPANPAEILATALAGPLTRLPERLVRTVLGDLGRPGARRRRCARSRQPPGRDPDVARLFREMAEREMISRIAERIGGADATRRAAVAASQMAGVDLHAVRAPPRAARVDAGR